MLAVAPDRGRLPWALPSRPVSRCGLCPPQRMPDPPSSHLERCGAGIFSVAWTDPSTAYPRVVAVRPHSAEGGVGPSCDCRPEFVPDGGLKLLRPQSLRPSSRGRRPLSREAARPCSDGGLGFSCPLCSCGGWGRPALTGRGCRSAAPVSGCCFWLPASQGTAHGPGPSPVPWVLHPLHGRFVSPRHSGRHVAGGVPGRGRC